MALIENMMYNFDYKAELNFGKYCKKTASFIFGGNSKSYPLEECCNIRIQYSHVDSEGELSHLKKYEYYYKDIKFKGQYSASKEAFITKERYGLFSSYFVEHDVRNCSNIKEM
jgi:hypothetical protein